MSTAAAVSRRDVRARELSSSRNSRSKSKGKSQKRDKATRRVADKQRSPPPRARRDPSAAPADQKPAKPHGTIITAVPAYFSNTTWLSLRDTSAGPEARYVGCYTNEEAFGRLRVYAGGRAGSNYGLARYHAESKGKRFFAVARDADPAYGHAFAFDKPLSRYVRDLTYANAQACATLYTRAADPVALPQLLQA